MSTRITTAQLVDWLGRWRDAVTDQKDHLTDLDRAIGDADHGFNLARGTAAVTEKLEATPPQDVAGLGKVAGMALVMSVGGASGPLYGTFFLRFGTAGGDATELDAPGLGDALHAALDGVIERGKAHAGDKTMLDAIIPALEAYDQAVADDADISAALAAAAAATATGRDATVPMIAHKGRASYLGERSAGHMDPGAASATLLFEALAAAAQG